MTKFVNVPTSLNNLKTKVDNLNVDESKTVSAALKKLSNVIDNEVVKYTKFSTLKTKVNNLENRIPNATTLIQINQYKTDEQNLEKKIGDTGLVSTTVLNTKISYSENKIPDTSSLVTTATFNEKIGEIENKIPDHAKYINNPEFNKLTAGN